MRPVNLFAFPKAILHIDGDAFFVSCEVALNPKLKGLPVITGAERGIVSSLSYEAKALGIKRAMSLTEVKKICPQTIILPSDYETYSLFSMRMYNIVKRFSDRVEEASIDECFVDLTGLQRPMKMSYETMANQIKHQLDTELGITFSVGLAPSKVLAKLASKWKKPSGLTIIAGYNIHRYLSQTPLQDIWGIGPNTTAYLQNQGLQTALDFAYKDKMWVQKKLTKPHYEIWQELKGQSVFPLTIGAKHNYKSISKTKTFTPPSYDRQYVLAQLSKNIENACIKARRHKLATQKVLFFLKTQTYKFHGLEIKLSRATSIPTEIIDLVLKHFDQVFRPSTLYRATGTILMNLDNHQSSQLDLFGAAIKAEKIQKIFTGVDRLSSKYGKHTVFLGSSFAAMVGPQHRYLRNKAAHRKNILFKGETSRKRLGLPMFGRVT